MPRGWLHTTLIAVTRAISTEWIVAHVFSMYQKWMLKFAILFIPLIPINARYHPLCQSFMSCRIIK